MSERPASAPREPLTRWRLNDMVSDVARTVTMVDVLMDSCFGDGSASRKGGVGREQTVGWWRDQGYTVLILTQDQERALLTAQAYAFETARALESAIEGTRDPIA